MAQYTLILDFDDAGLQRLSEGRFRVIVAKPSGNSRPNVAWLTAEPASRMTLVWDDSYGLYAAHVPFRDGAQIAIVAVIHPAVDGAIYPFAGMTFGEPTLERRVPRRHYDVRNDERTAVTFGLLQSATINGREVRAPLNAVVVPPGFTADFIAVTRIYLWIQVGGHDGSIVSKIPADAVIVAFEPTHATRYYRFEDRTGTFVALDGEIQGGRE